MTTKYPNADTSPERYADIRASHGWLLSATHTLDATERRVRDLLAMLEELHIAYEIRGRFLREQHAVNEEMRVDMRRISQQLHDQRWRRLSDEKPTPNQRCQFAYKTTHSFATLDQNYNTGFHVEAMWWRPIPPLPVSTTEREGG